MEVKIKEQRFHTPNCRPQPVASRKFGNYFHWTTDDPLNSYISSDGLHIVPTLTLDTTGITPDQLLDGYTLNLTSCTSTFASDCSVTSNATTSTIINPVRSARLSTKGKKSIKYGRVEVVAKLPAGDWLWPAIWCVNPCSFHLNLHFLLGIVNSRALFHDSTKTHLSQDVTRRLSVWSLAHKRRS